MPSHDIAQGKGGQVGGGFVHPRPVGGVEREVDTPHEDFALLQGGHGRFLPCKITGLNHARRPCGNQPLLVGAVTHKNLLFLSFNEQ